MKGGAVLRVEPVTRIEGQEIYFSSLGEGRRLVYEEPAIMNAGLESHVERIPLIPPDATLSANIL